MLKYFVVVWALTAQQGPVQLGVTPADDADACAAGVAAALEKFPAFMAKYGKDVQLMQAVCEVLPSDPPA